MIGKEEIKGILLGIGCDNYNRRQLFCNLCHDQEMTDEAYNYGLNLAYTCGNAGREAFFYFSDYRVSKDLIMEEKDKQLYDKLPQQLIIYRGCDLIESKEGNEFGISWTTERKVAEFFAFRYNNHNGRVFGLEIDKRDIIAYFTDRTEYEAIINIFDLEYSDWTKSPYIVTDKPTDLYITYVTENNPYLNDNTLVSR